MTMNNEKKSDIRSSGGLKSLSQGIDLLKLLAFEGPMRNGEMAERLNLSRPTISRIVNTLEQQGLVKRGVINDIVSLELGAAIIGYSYSNQSVLIKTCYPILVRFRRKFGLSIGLTAIDSMTGQGVYLLGLEDDSLADYPGDVGSLYSLLETPPGRVYIESLGLLEKKSLLRKCRANYGEEEWQSLMRKMESDYQFYSEHGFVISVGEVISSLNMIFISLDIPGSGFFALCCMAPQIQMSEELIMSEIAPELKVAKLEVERLVEENVKYSSSV